VRSSARRTGGTRAAGGGAGTEKPMTDDVGNDDLEVEAVAPSAVGRSKDAHDFLRTGGTEVSTGVDTGAGAGAVEVEVDAAEAIGATATGSTASTGVS
jgi:hypothetical protein